jgi:phosphohistidine phosphatase
MTTRQLVLVRHAKAGEGAVDRDRPLARRGVAEAPAVGRWLAQRLIAPDRVMVSPARRARQTWELAATELSAAPEPVLDDRIYHNTVEDLLQIIRETPAEVTTLAIVGHNPGLQNLAIALDDGRGDDAGRKELTTKYRTSGIAVFDIGGSWAQRPMSGEAVGMHMPAVVTLDDLAAMNAADVHGHRYETSPQGVLSVMPPPDSEHASAEVPLAEGA